jgi:RND family efflux transporter MFP subunit
MLDKPRPPVSVEPDILHYRVPRRLKLAGIVGSSLIVLVVVVGLTTRSLSENQTKVWTREQAIPTVRLIALKGSSGRDFTLPGDIEAFTTATIYAQISGYVQNWLVDIGTPVKAGQLLAQIDPRPYQAALDQANGQLARDAANLSEAQLDLKRYQALAQQNAISAQQLSTQQALVASDNGIVQTDKAAVELAEINLKYTRIVAPFSGVVTSRSVDVGQLVVAGNASATPLFTVTDQSKLRIYVRMPQSYSSLVQPGMSATFTVPEYPGSVFKATLVASANAVISQSGTQLVEFQIDNAEHALKPGDYAQMNFGIVRGLKAVRVPVTALIFRDQGMQVAMVDDSGKVTLRSIHISNDFGAAVEVNAGLKSGDEVIDNPTDSLRLGDKVNIIPANPRS